MSHLFVGVGKVQMNLRHAQSLKDKRSFLNSVEQKLKNRGFSVTHCGFSDNPKRALIGFACVGADHGAVERLLEEGVRLFWGNGELLDSQTDVFDYSEMKEENFESYVDKLENE